jgi:hypothetical protein
LLQNGKVIKFGQEASTVSPRILSALNKENGRSDGGPNSFKYIEGKFFSTANAEFHLQDLAMTEEDWFKSIKDRPSVINNVLRFERKYNIRCFDFILSYSQVNRWTSNAYEAVPINKQYKGSLVFTGCSFIYEKDIGEHLPLTLHAWYELIGDSLGEGDSIDEMVANKSGPGIEITYTYDTEYVYVYISGLYPYRLSAIGNGKFEDISAEDNTGQLTYEEKRPVLVETDHYEGTKTEKDFQKDNITYCDISISLKDYTIVNEERIEFVPIANTNISGIKNNNKVLVISPNRNGAIKTSGVTIANDVNVEVSSDIHPLRFGSRAFDMDKEKIHDIAKKIEDRIKDAAIPTGRVPFIIRENLRFHGFYNIIDDYFVDSAADSFAKFYITEVGFYDAVIDDFSITNYFFDFNSDKDLTTSGDLKSFFQNASSEFSQYLEGGNIKRTFKSSNPLFLMKEFEFVPSADYKKYSEVTYIKSNSGPVNKAFIELAKEGNTRDFDKIIYFSYNDEEGYRESNIYNAVNPPHIIVCDFNDYNMQYVVRKNIFKENFPYNVNHITVIISYHKEDSPYSDTYLIGTSAGVFYKMMLDETFAPVISEDFHNPFLNNEETENDSIYDNEAIVDIQQDDDYLYFIGKTKFALYDKSLEQYIKIDQRRYGEALNGQELKYVKRLGDNNFIFVTSGGVIVYDTISRIFTNNNINYKYHIDFKNSYASNFLNINHNFEADNITNASIIQVGQFVYLLGSQTLDGSVCQKLNILTGEVTDITSDSFHHIKPFVCSNGRVIFCIGGKTIQEISSVDYSDVKTPYRIYDIIKDTWTDTEYYNFDITDTAGTGYQGRLSACIPVMANNDEYIYIFHPELVSIGTINYKYYNNKGLKISINDIGNVTNFDVNIPEGANENNELPFNLGISWVPIQYNKDGCIFIAMYKVEETYTYHYNYVRFSIEYSSFILNILDKEEFSGSAFNNYDDDGIPLDALNNARVFINDKMAIVFCRDKFLIIVDESGSLVITPLDDGTLLSKAVYDSYWNAIKGNKTNRNAYFINKDEYLVFAGGEGYKASDYFDLNQFTFIKTPRYGGLEEDILDATTELLKVPSSSLTVGSMSSYILDTKIYIVSSISTNSLALDNYSELSEYSEVPFSLLLFEVDLTKREPCVVFLKDLTPAVQKKGYIDGFKLINLYSVGKYLFVTLGHGIYYNKDLGTYHHENKSNWGNVIVYNMNNDTLIDFSDNNIDIEGIGLFPLIFRYGEKYTIICKDRDITEFYPIMDSQRDSYVVGYQCDYGNHVNTWSTNGNNLTLASEDELTFKYASAASYGQFGFIVTSNTIEIVELDRLMKEYGPNDDKNIVSTIIYRFSEKDKALFKDIFVNGEYLYITGGLNTKSAQNDSEKGINNRMLRFNIQDILKVFTLNIGTRDISDKYKEIPEVMQLSSSAVKYFSSYGVSPAHSLITVGDIHFINETNPDHQDEGEAFDALISFKKSIYKDINKSFIKKNRFYKVEKVPQSISNVQGASSYHVFNYLGRDFILSYGGKQTPTTYVNLYDITYHKWIDIPVLPVLLKDITLVDNKIVGATRINDDLTEEAENVTISLELNENNNWVWVERAFSSGSHTLNTFNSYARITEEGSYTSLIVSRNENGMLPENQQILICDEMTDITAQLPPIPVSSSYHYKVVGCDIISEGENKYCLVSLYTIENKTFSLWSFNGNSWVNLFQGMGFGNKGLEPDKYTFIRGKYSQCLLIKYSSSDGSILLGRIKWKFKNCSAYDVCQETCGVLDGLESNTDVGYSVTSGNIYLRNDDDISYILKDDIVFRYYNQNKVNSLLKNETVNTSFARRLNSDLPYAIKDAIDIKQIAIDKDGLGLVLTVFTLNSTSNSGHKDYFCTVYDIINQRQSKIFEIKYGDNGDAFSALSNISFELLPSPEQVSYQYETEEGDCNVLLVTGMEELVILYRLSFNLFGLFSDTEFLNIVSLGELVLDGTRCDLSKANKYAISKNGQAIYQFASYNGNDHSIYKGELDWPILLDDYSNILPPINVEEQGNDFASVENSTNIGMISTNNGDIIILLDQYYGGEGEYAKRKSRLYVAHENYLEDNPLYFDVFELPLTVGSVDIVKSDNDCVYIVPKKSNNKQPIIKWHNGEINYIDIGTPKREMISNPDKDIDASWVYLRGNIYNTFYGVAVPVNTVIEQKLPLSYQVNKSANKLVNFTTYKNYIYVLSCKSEDDTMSYYLDTVDCVTLEVLSSRIITKGPSITQQSFSIPVAGSILSIDLTGSRLIIAGGVKQNNQANKVIYCLSIETATLDKLFSDIDVGNFSVYYESQSDNVLYAFSNTSQSMIIISYDGSSSPIIIPYDGQYTIKGVLCQTEENKLIVLGSIASSNDNVIFELDMFTGNTSNFSNTEVTGEIKGIVKDRLRSLIYSSSEDGKANVYNYDRENHIITLIDKGISSVLLDGKVKIDGIYESDSFIGLDISNNSVSSPSFYRFSLVHSYAQSKGSQYCLSNQINTEDEYNKESFVKLTGLYESVTVNNVDIKFYKKLSKLRLFNADYMYINCDKLLWASKFYSDKILLAAMHNGISTVYYIDIKTKNIVYTENVSTKTSLHDRKTNEVEFAYNSHFTAMDGGEMQGSVYISGGESSSNIFQDILEINIRIASGNMQTVLTSILPNNGTSGVYKSKILSLQNRQITVIGGMSYKGQADTTVNSTISKLSLSYLVKNESSQVHYITPDKEYIKYFISTRNITIKNTIGGLTIPIGEITEAFVASNKAFVVNKGHRYVAEINESKLLGDFIEFTANNESDNKVVPGEWEHIDKDMHYKKNVNRSLSSVSHNNNLSYFTGKMSYYLDLIPYQSQYDKSLLHTFVSNNPDGSVTREEVKPRSVSVIGFVSPSAYENSGYDFDILFEKNYSNISRKEYINDEDYIKTPQDKATIISRVPCTTYMADINKMINYNKYEDEGEYTNMAFIYDNGTHLLKRDDYSYYNNTWQVTISNGPDIGDKRIRILLSREEENEVIYNIRGDNEKFPFNNNLIPTVLAYGEMKEKLNEYRYLLFIDVKGNVVTFDRSSESFVSVEGYENIEVPYLSGELIIYPSRTIKRGSIGKRVWSYSGQNPYIAEAEGDKVSLDDGTLV